MKELLVFIAVMSLAGLAGAVPGVAVQMTSRDAFVPKTLTIKAGNTVVWENDSPGVHTVTDNPAFASAKQDASTPAGAEPFNSGPVDAGKQYSHTFMAPDIQIFLCPTRSRWDGWNSYRDKVASTDLGLDVRRTAGPMVCVASRYEAVSHVVVTGCQVDIL